MPAVGRTPPAPAAAEDEGGVVPTGKVNAFLGGTFTTLALPLSCFLLMGGDRELCEALIE